MSESSHSGSVEVVVGRIGRAHGLHGEVAVSLRTDEPQTRFAQGATLRIEGSGRELHVQQTRSRSAAFQVRFREIDTRTGAEALQGKILVAEVAAEERPTGEEEYYDRQLRGLAVLDWQQHRIGRVSDVIHLPAQDLLAIDVDGQERLVPFVSALVPTVDLDAGTLTLADVGGLVDADAEEAR
ncbi:ribosome maturation factor RimM [Acidipropionibacterium jensenii]|uniref:Ribosome maturation factor RimM n=1 Tax=Acidipropionibacterium jensenii TaxID=1749 RepID=A0A3T0RYM6_9ACTN|nr:ribosome maturation factor RimM [Acidipropionibacterium jensenii]AZZ39200.1 ribosome maturation factor RimM [Acidipropionibacterium jensenii]